MKTINEKQDEIIKEFEKFENWTEKYKHIIEYGKKLQGLENKYKEEDNLVKGCQSKVWLRAFMDGDLLKFEADSNAIITKGLVGLIVNVFSGHSPKEIIDSKLYFVNEIGLADNLSISRSNGLVSMMKKIKNYAIAYYIKTAE